MGQGGGRQPDQGADHRDLPARRRVLVRPADLRAVRRLLGSSRRDARPSHRRGVERVAQVRRIDHAHRTRWADTTVLSGDLAAAVGRLKAKPGGELQVHGSGTLIRWLLGNDLVDEITLLIVPVVLGQGTRLFPGTGPDMALDLVESRADSKGVMIQVYRPAGRPQYATG